MNLDDEATATQLPEPPATANKIKAADLLNLLNYINFQDGTVFATFRHPTKDETVSFQAFPQPSEDKLACRWMAPGLPAAVSTYYHFESLLVSDGHNLITVAAQVVALDRDRAVFALPEFGYEKSSRKVRRHSAESISVRVYQNGVSFAGALVDFNAVSFQATLESDTEGSFHGLNLTVPLTVLFEKEGRLLFSGECRVTRTEGAGRTRVFVLSPTFNNLRRFPPKAIRSVRHVLNPTPSVSVIHPLTGTHFTLQLSDLSSIGFGVEEFFETSLLLPGLVLPDLELQIGNQFLLRCSAQVLYRNVFVQGSKSIARCGVVFLDLSLEDQARLAALLHQTMSSRLRVCSAVDMEELWRFFFESGFLYPSKYGAIETYKQEFKKIYEKLYLGSPQVSRHFLFQDKGVLFAHMSMVRVYPRAWLIHHHAAAKSGYGMAGIAVLEQVGYYINEFHVHRSTRMNYVMCYYRRENKFPHRVFGGAFQDVDDPKGISLDSFAYLHLPETTPETSSPFQLLPASESDLSDLKKYYEAVSGGLMLEAMNLAAPIASNDELTAQYARLGLVRSHQVFSWKQHGVLKAVVTLQISDLGLNLSNLTNCLHVIVVDPEGLSPQDLFSGLAQLSHHYDQTDLPVLVYPKQYMDERNVPYEKEYLLWVLSMTHTDGYFRSLGNRFKRSTYDKH